MINFTTEQKERLAALIALLTFTGETVEGAFGSNEVTPWDAINACKPSTLETLYNKAKRAKQAAERENKWQAAPADAAKAERLKIWEEFLDLSWGYSLWKLEEETRAKEKARKQAALDSLIEENKTPQERIDQLKAELAAL